MKLKKREKDLKKTHHRQKLLLKKLKTKTKIKKKKKGNKNIFLFWETFFL